MADPVNARWQGRGGYAQALVLSQADHLVRMIIQQDLAAANWVKFLLAAQSALVVAHGYICGLVLLGPVKGQSTILPSLMMFPPIFGIGLAWFGCQVVRREYAWSAQFMQNYNDLPGFRTKVFLDGYRHPGLQGRKPGYIARRFRELSLGLIAAWATAAVIALWALYRTGYRIG